jgi:hypothetical protein
MTDPQQPFDDDTRDDLGGLYGEERGLGPAERPWADDDEPFATWLETSPGETALPEAAAGSVGRLGDSEFDAWLRATLEDVEGAPTEQELTEWILRRRSAGA